jgi:hypothetical protein
MVRIEVGEPEEILEKNNEQLNNKITNWRSKISFNNQEGEGETNLNFPKTFEQNNIQFMPLYSQSPFIETEEPIIQRNILNPTRNLGLQTDYQRRYQLERTTRTFLQRIFDLVEHSSVFQWFRNLSKQSWESPNNQQESLQLSRKRRRTSFGNYGNNAYYGSNYSKQEAFIENLVTKWIQFRNSMSGAVDSTPEEEIRNDREFASDLADKIDRFTNQEQRYFQRSPNFQQKSFFSRFWKKVRNLFYIFFSGSKRALFALVDFVLG